ncbi:MAG: ribosome biogenesis GTPase Der [Bacteroidales bacterium]
MNRIVAIVGRPNVGKSTLFNRLTETQQAIVDEQAGVTRDRLYGKCIWNGVEFSVIDTGGYIHGSEDVFEEEIRKQVVLALEESDVVLFLTDAMEGITHMDEAVADLLRQSGKPVLLIVNKVDNHDLRHNAHEFYSLGLGDPNCISSINGSGTGDLLDALVNSFKKAEPGEQTENFDELPKIAIVGRPNVGKSSLTNAFLGEERNIVTPIAGTTRDSIYTRYNKFGHEFFLIDTAGLRKKAKVTEDLEFYSVLRSIRAIENADVCLLLLDATQGLESQDMNIFSLIKKNNKGLVILVNKWDLIEKDNKTTDQWKKMLESRIAPFNDVPIIFTSVVSKQRIHKALESAIEVFENRRQRISTSKLNEFLEEVVDNYPPPANKGKYIKIKYVTQLPTPTPMFAFFCNLPQYIKEPYKRYLENKMREKFNFTGVPIQIFFRKK